MTDTQLKIAVLQEELHGQITAAEAAHLDSVVASRRQHACLEVRPQLGKLHSELHMIG